jgi:hypothetical protein
MQPKRRRVGTGITEREEIDPSWLVAEDDPDQFLDRLPFVLSLLPTSGWYERLRNNAGLVLRTLRLPSTYGFYRQDENGHWIEDAGWRDKFLEHERLLSKLNDPEFEPDYERPLSPVSDGFQSLDEIAKDKFGCDSIPHFMAQILSHICSLEVSREVNNGVGAEMHAYWIGHLSASLRLKLNWENQALSGQKMQSKLADARGRGARARKAKAQEWRKPACKLASDIWRDRPGLSISEAARRVRKRLVDAGYSNLPNSDRAIRDVIGDLSPQKNGSI